MLVSLTSSAFLAPTSAVAPHGHAIQRAASPAMQWSGGGGGKWEPAWKKSSPVVREYDTPAAAAPAAASSAAPSASMTVVQAMAFMVEAPGTVCTLQNLWSLEPPGACLLLEAPGSGTTAVTAHQRY